MGQRVKIRSREERKRGLQLSLMSSTRSLIYIMMHQQCFSQQWPRIDNRQPVRRLVPPGRNELTVPDRPGLAVDVGKKKVSGTVLRREG